MQAAVIRTKKHQLPVVILEIEGSVPAALIWATTIFIAYLHCFW